MKTQCESKYIFNINFLSRDSKIGTHFQMEKVMTILVFLVGRPTHCLVVDSQM